MTIAVLFYSIIGLISIPGMMTGQLIAGASVMNAAKSQQIIMFLISGAAAFGTLSSVMVSVDSGSSLPILFPLAIFLKAHCSSHLFHVSLFQQICLRVCFDSSDRLRPERIIKSKSIVPKVVQDVFSRIGDSICCCWYSSKARKDSRSGTSSPSLEQGNGRNGRRGRTGSNSPRQNGGQHQNKNQNGEPTERTPLVRSS